MIALTIVGAVVVFVGYGWWHEYCPESVEVIYQSEGEMIGSDTLTILSWNIGYAGLGDNTDFFYDGGEMVQDTPERTAENLREIISFLGEHSWVDFILLQEVDLDSKRTYHVDQFEEISAALPDYYGWMALNYKASYVPIPLFSAIGQVESGMALFSRYKPLQVVRLQYPSEFGFPTRLFNLKRCLLSSSFLSPSGVVYINNTHNTAYDTGGMRTKEFAFLRDYLSDKPFSLTAGDWNSNPPGYVASRGEIENEYFSPISIEEGSLGDGVTFAYDTLTDHYTARYGYQAYDPQSTIRTVIDFVAVGSGFEVLDIRVLDLGFRNSDHNPVIFRVRVVR
ncbi:MAG: hypothetical protein R3Y19_03560 [Rikenellaceae bacterium]